MQRAEERLWFVILLLALASVAAFFTACRIEEEEPLPTGSLRVTCFSDTATRADLAARIFLNNRETPYLTPALIPALPVGEHTVRVHRPGYEQRDTTVYVALNRVQEISLAVVRAASGALDLVNAPDGTVLLLNSIPAGSVQSGQTLFSPLGTGLFRVSAYLPGHATERPSQATIRLVADSIVRKEFFFTPVPISPRLDSLAPPFPDLISDWGNARYRLQDYRGQVVLITFFFYHCSACIAEFPYIAEIYKHPAYQGRVQFLGVDFTDSYTTFSRFRDDHRSLGITFPLLHDPRQQVRQAYGVTTCPANFVVDATGRVRLIEGSIPEAVLRHTLDELLAEADAPTFRFTMFQTHIRYTDRNRSYEFRGLLQNLLPAERFFVYKLRRVAVSDTSRPVSICVGQLCFLPATDSLLAYQLASPALRSDTITYTIYSYVWDSTYNQIEQPLRGDYRLDVSISPQDAPADSAGYSLLLEDANPELVRGPARPRVFLNFRKQIEGGYVR